MRLFFWIVLIFPLIITSCSKDKTVAGGGTLPPKTLVANENILAKTLLYTEWSTVPATLSMTRSDMRNSLISDLASKCKNTLVSLQGMSDYDLAWSALMYKFLIDSGTKSASELKNMSLDDFRNTVISLNAAHTDNSVSKLQNYGNNLNLNITYSWWFYQNSSSRLMIDKFNDVSGSGPSFNKKDSRGSGMDVLRIVKADEDYTYLGIYHSMVSDGHFKLYLAGSKDLLTWTFISEMGDRAHQGDIEKWGNGYLVANEQDVVQGSNNVQIRYYASYSDLIANNPSFSKSVPQTFSTLAEGTPDIRKVEGDSPEASYILIGYHFYDHGIRDQQAFGILHNFTEWRTWIDEISNYNIQEMGYLGNIGARSGFIHAGNYVLQEAQLTSGDWSSWRLLFGNGAFYYTLHPATPSGSISFANPGIAQLNGANSFAVTSFLPSQGNQNGEPGELLYQVNF